MTRTTALVAVVALLSLSNVFTVVKVLVLAGHADDAIVAIQQQRTQGCLDQNGRHDSTIAELGRLIALAEGKATPAARARIEASKGSTELLINDLAPKRDCARINQKPH